MKSVSVLGNEILDEVKKILSDLPDPSFNKVSSNTPGTLNIKSVDIRLGSDDMESLTITLYQRKVSDAK